VDKPEAYGLPADPKMPTRNLKRGSAWSALSAVIVGVVGLISLRARRMDDA
jgi:formate dehydrogenase iron-sulfur subunit